MIEQLFGSKTRVKLLQLFYSNPNRAFYVREITRKIDEQINSVRRELANLLSIGIISSDTTNNRLYYEVNQKYEYYLPLSMVFGNTPVTAATTGSKKAPAAAPKKAPASPEQQELKSIGNVEAAIYTGQFTRDETAGVDLLIIGDVNHTKLVKFVEELEGKEGKEIRYTVLQLPDYEYRKQVKDRFITAVNEAKKQVLIDKAGLFGDEI